VSAHVTNYRIIEQVGTFWHTSEETGVRLLLKMGPLTLRTGIVQMTETSDSYKAIP